MSEEAVLNLSRSEAAEKAKADRYLAEALSILRELAAERNAQKTGTNRRPGIVEEVRAILSRA